MRWSSNALLALRLGAVLFCLAGAILWALWSGTQQIQHAQEQGSENVQLIELYTDRLIQTQTVLKEAIRRHVVQQPQAYLHTSEFQDFLWDLQKAQPATQGLAVLTSSDGSPIAASRGFPLYPPLALEDYRANLSEGSEIFVDRTVGKDGRDAFIIAMPFVLPAGNGIFVSAIEVLSIRGFLQSIATGAGEAGSLLREDGRLLVRNVPSRPMTLDPTSAARLSLSVQDDGHYRTVAASDHVERHYAFARVGDLPLFAIFGIPVANVREAWLAQATPVWLFLAALGLFTLLLAGRIQRGIENSLQQRETQEQLAGARHLAAQRAQLLQELNHRVKNNLAMIGSLISFQMRQTGAVDAETLKARLQAVGEVHALLYRAQENNQVDLGQLFSRLARSPAIVPPERGISINFEAEGSIFVGPDSAIPLSLIVAELLTNAVKHAFSDVGNGSIALHLSLCGDYATLEFADDGVGAPAVTDRRSGLRILEGLLAQAEATLTRRPGPGTHYTLTFPIRGMTLPELRRSGAPAS